MGGIHLAVLPAGLMQVAQGLRHIGGALQCLNQR